MDEERFKLIYNNRKIIENYVYMNKNPKNSLLNHMTQSAMRINNGPWKVRLFKASIN